MIDKKLLKFMGFQIRMYEKVLGDTADTTYFVKEQNQDIMNLMKELMTFGGEE